MIQRRPGAGTATETLAVMTLVGVFVAGTACSSGGSPGDDDAGDSGAGEEPTGPAPGADVGRPSVTGPVTGGSRDQPFNAMPPRLAERARYDKRMASTMEELQAFYDAAFPRLEDAMAYLDQFAIDELPDDATRLLWLFCALTTASFPVEVWRQPKVPDSGSSSFDAVVEPTV